MQETRKRDDIEDFEKNLQNLRKSMLGNTDSDARERKIQELVNQTSSIVTKLEKDNVSVTIQDIASKILKELK